MAQAARRERLIAGLRFLGSTCFWLLMAGAVLFLLTFLYDRQLFGLDIPFLILLASCAGFAIIAFATVLYLLISAIVRP